MAISVSLKVVVVSWLVVAALASPACPSITSQTTCASTAGCAYRTAGSQCVRVLPEQSVWVKANDIYYAQIPIPAFAADGTFDGPQLEVINNVKSAKVASVDVPAGPALGQLIPWDADTTHYRNQQPPLVQVKGTFAYRFEVASSAPVTTFPRLDSFEYTFTDAADNGVYWGIVRLTIAHPSVLIDTEAYRCKDTVAGMKNGVDWNGPFSKGPIDVCYRGHANSIYRPWVTRQELPRVWAEVSNANINDNVITYGPLVDGLEVRWMNNALNITANGRLGYSGQRVYGFTPFKFEDSRTNANAWNTDSATGMPQTMSFDKSCVSGVSSASPNGWGNVFGSLPNANSLTVASGTRQCSSFQHSYLCANAPFLTVQSGYIQTLTNTDSIHKQPWTTLLDACMIWTTGVFKWDLIQNYCKNGKYGTCGTGNNVFDISKVGNDWLIRFDFFNTAIQPASQINNADQKARGWIEINHKYQVSLTLAGRLDFNFETGIDIFTVDVQWFRYQSLNPTEGSATLFDRGLGINLIVYPEGYNAGYPQSNPLRDTVDSFKVYHNNVPKKVTGIIFYKNPEDTTDTSGDTTTNRPVGLPAPYQSDHRGWSDEDNHLKVNPCKPETSTATPANSCDFQNLTARIRMPNDGNDNFQWTGRLIFQFTLNQQPAPEHPNFIMDMNYKQTAIAREGSFSATSATCRTYPKLLEQEVKTRDPNIPYQGHGMAPESQCAGLSQTECGPSARETSQGGNGLGCIWSYNRQACVPGYSVTCQDVDSKTFGPTDRSIVVFDITDVDSSCTSMYKLWFTWTSGGVTNKVYAVFPADETLPTESGVTVAKLMPNFEFLMFQPLSELERNMYPLPQTNLWDYGFVFEPGTINDNVHLTITAQMRISLTCASRRHHSNKKALESSRRFRTLAESDSSSMSFEEQFTLQKSSLSRVSNNNVGTINEVAPKAVVSSSSTEQENQIVQTRVNNTPLYIAIGCVFSAILVAALFAVAFVKRSRSGLARVPSKATM
eukprot:PhF_6_TR8304/c3_g1_i2/m.12830